MDTRPPAGPPRDDTARIVRFVAVKAALFIGLPLVAAVAVIALTLR